MDFGALAALLDGPTCGVAVPPSNADRDIRSYGADADRVRFTAFDGDADAAGGEAKW